MKDSLQTSDSNTTTNHRVQQASGGLTADVPPKRILVIGGTLFYGRLLVSELVRSGHDVYLLHRQPGHNFGRRVHNLVADRNDSASVRRAIGNTRFDVVYDNVYDWENGTTGSQVEATAHIFDGRVEPLRFHVERCRLRRRPEPP